MDRTGQVELSPTLWLRVPTNIEARTFLVVLAGLFRGVTVSENPAMIEWLASAFNGWLLLGKVGILKSRLPLETSRLGTLSQAVWVTSKNGKVAKSMVLPWVMMSPERVVSRLSEWKSPKGFVRCYHWMPESVNQECFFPIYTKTTASAALILHSSGIGYCCACHILLRDRLKTFPMSNDC